MTFNNDSSKFMKKRSLKESLVVVVLFLFLFFFHSFIGCSSSDIQCKICNTTHTHTHTKKKIKRSKKNSKGVDATGLTSHGRHRLAWDVSLSYKIIINKLSKGLLTVIKRALLHLVV